MRIKIIHSQYRRDFKATYKCEHCGNEVIDFGYDDRNFHNNVVPNMECTKCGKKANEDYRPLDIMYPEGYQI